MVLNDLVKEYKLIRNDLKLVETFYKQAKIVVNFYESEFSEITQTYYTSPSSAPKEELCGNLMDFFQKIYSEITLLNSSIREVYKCIGILERYNLKNPVLKDSISSFINSADASIDWLYEIIEKQMVVAQKKGLFFPLVKNLHSLILYYDSLLKAEEHLSECETLLYEPIPKNLSGEDFSNLELKSSKHNVNFSEFADDIKLLSSFLDQLDIILSKRDDYIPIITRKIETGSLRIVWGGRTVELTCISDIIQAVSDAIRVFRLTGVEKRLKEESVKSVKLDNDKKALSIINSQITTISDKLGLDPSKPEDKETIQRLCLPIVKYINNNPIGRIGDFNYNLSNEIKLLEDTYFKNEN